MANPTPNYSNLSESAKPETLAETFDNKPEAIESFETENSTNKTLPFVREFHHEKAGDDLGLPKNPIYSNYVKNMWKRKPMFRKIQ